MDHPVPTQVHFGYHILTATKPCFLSLLLCLFQTASMAKVDTNPDMDWDSIFAKFPVSKTDTNQKERRTKLFTSFDPNGNGYLSLAEVDKGCRGHLGLYGLFEAKKPIMRAYQAAKDVAPSSSGVGSGGLDGKDYVEKSEFRLLLLYLRDYFVLWKVFESIDTGADARIDKDEVREH